MTKYASDIVKSINVLDGGNVHGIILGQKQCGPSNVSAEKFIDD